MKRFEYRGRWWVLASGVCIVDGACTATLPVIMAVDGSIVLRLSSMDVVDILRAIDEWISAA